jgi:hypothetical protein
MWIIMTKKNTKTIYRTSIKLTPPSHKVLKKKSSCTSPSEQTCSTPLATQLRFVLCESLAPLLNGRQYGPQLFVFWWSVLRLPCIPYTEYPSTQVTLHSLHRVPEYSGYPVFLIHRVPEYSGYPVFLTHRVPEYSGYPVFLTHRVPEFSDWFTKEL